MLLSQRLAMVVDQCAEAVRIFAERSEEHMLGLCLDGIEQRRSEDVVVFVHESAFAVVINIDIAVGFLEDVVAVLILATGVVIQWFDALVDNMIHQFTIVVKQPLNAVVLGSNQSLRPIDLDGFVRTAQNRLEVVVIDYTLVTETGVIQTTVVASLDALLCRQATSVAPSTERECKGTTFFSNMQIL